MLKDDEGPEFTVTGTISTESQHLPSNVVKEPGHFFTDYLHKKSVL